MIYHIGIIHSLQSIQLNKMNNELWIMKQWDLIWWVNKTKVKWYIWIKVQNIIIKLDNWLLLKQF